MGTLRKGQTLGAYTVEEPLGAGHFGESYLASAQDGGRFVIKVLKADLVRTGEAPELFARLREAVEDLRRSEHPGVVLPLQLVEGPPCYGIICPFRSEPGPRVLSDDADAEALARHLEAFLGPLKAVAWLHRQGFVHGNLTPNNVLMGGSEAGEGAILDVHWSALGFHMPSPDEPSFLSPEQRNGSPPGAASDQYAMGAILSATLSPSLRSRAPAMLDTVLRRAMQMRPEARFPGLNGFVEAIEGIIEGIRSPRRASMISSTPSGSPIMVEDAASANSVFPLGLGASVEDQKFTGEIRVDDDMAPYMELGALHLANDDSHPSFRRRTTGGSWMGRAAVVLVLVLGAVAAVVFLGGRGVNLSAFLGTPSSVAVDAGAASEPKPARIAVARSEAQAQAQAAKAKQVQLEADQARKRAQAEQAARLQKEAEVLARQKAELIEAERKAEIERKAQEERTRVLTEETSVRELKVLEAEADQAIDRLEALENNAGSPSVDVGTSTRAVTESPGPQNRPK
jgi:hypothetical protein